MKMFNVLRVIWNLNRVGVAATANTCADTLGISRYRARKIAHSCAEIDLVSWVSTFHRPNVNKRSYYLTDRGRCVLLAYYGKPLDFRGVLQCQPS